MSNKLVHKQVALVMLLFSIAFIPRLSFGENSESTGNQNKSQPTASGGISLRSEHDHVEASGSGTAIGQLATKEFSLNVSRISIYNISISQAPHKDASTLERIRSTAIEIQTLLDAGYTEEAISRLDASFNLFFATPELVSSQPGLLVLTNLHILRARMYADSGSYGSAINEYLKPIPLLSPYHSLKQDYVRRITGEQVFLKEPDGVDFLISTKCPSNPDLNCPTLTAYRLRLILKQRSYDFFSTRDEDAKHAELQNFFDRTRPNREKYAAFADYLQIMVLRFNVLTSAISILNYKTGGFEYHIKELGDWNQLIQDDVVQINQTFFLSNAQRQDLAALELMLLNNAIILNAYVYNSAPDLSDNVQKNVTEITSASPALNKIGQEVSSLAQTCTMKPRENRPLRGLCGIKMVDGCEGMAFVSDGTLQNCSVFNVRLSEGQLLFDRAALTP